MDVSPPNKNGLPYFTPREREVCHWMRHGKSNWAIGRILDCEEGTVKKHLQRIYRKLGVSNRMEAANALGSNSDFDVHDEI